MKQYLKYRIWDLFLCLCISIGLAVNVLSGFRIDDVTRRMPVLVITVIVILLICFAAAVNKRTTIAGILLAVAAFVAATILCRSRSLFTDDAQNATMVFFVVVIVVTVLAFLACRSRIGILILFLLGNLIQAAAAFLHFPVQTWGYLLFLFSAALMIFYRVYVFSVLRSHTGKVRFTGFMVQNFCICLAAFIVATGIFAGVVRPLNPPTDDLKLIQKLMSFDVLQKIGVSSVVKLPDNEKQSEQPTDRNIATDQREEKEPDGDGKLKETPDQETQNLEKDQKNAGETTETAKAVTYETKSHWYLYVILAAVVICLLFLLRSYLRKRWLQQIRALPKREGVINLYAYFLMGLRIAGCRKAGNLTLREFLSLNEKELQKFECNGITFAQLTAVYQRAYYGQKEISEDAFQMYLEYYAGFRKKIRKVAKKRKLLVIFFRL